LGSSPYCPDVSRHYRRTLCAPYQLRTALSLYQSPRWPPDLKILMFSGSKKGTQIYYPFLSRVPTSESPPGSPTGPLRRERNARI